MKIYPVSPIQRYCLLVSGRKNYGADMNVGACLYFPIDLDSSIVVDRVRQCLTQHPALNARFGISQDEHIYQFIENADNFVEYIDSSYEITNSIGDESIFQHYRKWYAARGVSRNHADLVSAVVSRNKHIEYALYDEIPRRVSIIGSPSEGYTICLSFHHAMCDATSVSILQQYLNDHIQGEPSCRDMQFGFLDRCVNEDERLPSVQSRQLQYWEKLLSSSKDESDISLIDREAGLCLSKVIHSYDIRSMSGSGKMTQFPHLCALYEGLEAVSRISRRNIISTIDNRRSAEDFRIIGCMFRHLIWSFPEDAYSSRAELRKFLIAQAMRHYQNVDVTLDLILENYSAQRGRFPALDAGFSFRTGGGGRPESVSKSEMVPQYIDALYERLKFHLHVVIDGDLAISYLVYNKDFVAPNELEMFERKFVRALEHYAGVD
jgi:hypothetical protein